MLASNLTGKQFSKLTVLHRVKNKTRHAKWLCVCQCGNKIEAFATNLKTGNTQSCGCLNKQLIAKRSTTHNSSHTTEYKAWDSMKHRCYNKNYHLYHRYGARGIKVCDSWVNSFENFLNDMGLKPTPSHSLDRINNDLEYSKSNCRWASISDQANNRSNNIHLTFNNKTLTCSQWAKTTGIKSATIRARIQRYGWSIEDALTKGATSF